MPVYVDGPLASLPGPTRRAARSGTQQVVARSAAKNGIDIAVVNNMPDGALEATERQFVRLIDSAANGCAVRLTFYGLAEVPRSESGRRHVTTFYSTIEDLWTRRLDGLIVTGAEPRFPNLNQEAYWASLMQVIEWSERNTSSSIWSCLAAHAAALHLDGLTRRRFDEKRFGLFSCVRNFDHGLTTGTPPIWTVPHSRWNELDEKELLACGYRVLSRSEEAGADTFVKQRRSLFVFFQGHPEYEADTLMLEYRRDVSRFLKWERESYPPMPLNYFGASVRDALAVFKARAVRDRREELLSSFPADLLKRNLRNRWQSSAARLYGNWLSFLLARKESAARSRGPALKSVAAGSQYAAGRGD